MRLQALSERVQVICGPPVNIGIILLSRNRVVLIDSGLDRRFAKKVLEILTDYRYQVEAIINTHAHSDHIGGNSFFAQNAGCKIFAGHLEVPAIHNPLMQPIALFGAAPFQDLLNFMLVAEPSDAEKFQSSIIKFDDVEIQIVDLPGHSIGQKGFLVDGVMFIADALFSISAVEKHRLLYFYDPLIQLETFKKLKLFTAEWFVGGHFEPVNNLEPILSFNEKHVAESFSFLEKILLVPQPFDRILKEFLGNFGVKKVGWEHFLYRATLNGYLSALKRLGKINYKVLDNLLLWFFSEHSP